MSATTKGAVQLSTLKSLYYGNVTLRQYVQEDHIRIVDSYHSTGGYDNGDYLVKYGAESTNHHNFRIELSAFDNIFQPEIDYKILPVYSKAIERTVEGAAKKRVEAFIDNVDSQGSTITGYLKEKMIDTELNTSTFFIVSAPEQAPIDNTDLTKLPYLINVDPLNCSGYHIDQYGKLAILAWPKEYDMQKNIVSFQVWEKTPNDGGSYYVVNQQYSDKKLTLAQSQEKITVPFNVKYFPVIMAKLGIKKEYYDAPPPKYRSTTKQLVQVFNIRNWILSSIADTCFSPLLIQTEDGKLPSELSIGNDNALGYAAGLNPPERLRVNTDHLEFQEQYCERREISIRKQMDSYTQIAESASGEARKEASRKIILYWMNVGETSANLERWIYDIALKNYITSDYKVTVKYPIDYASLTPEVILDQIERINASFMLDGETKRELFSTLINEIFGQDKTKVEDIMTAFDKDTANGFNTGDGIGIDENDQDQDGNI